MIFKIFCIFLIYFILLIYKNNGTSLKEEKDISLTNSLLFFEVIISSIFYLSIAKVDGFCYMLLLLIELLIEGVNYCNYYNYFKISSSLTLDITS